MVGRVSRSWLLRTRAEPARAPFEALLGTAHSLAASVRRSPAKWLSAASLATTVLLVAPLHAFFWKHLGRVGFDDGYTMALGERLIDGKWLPYVDGCSHRGPLLYWAAGVAQLITGRLGWKGARVLSITTTYASLVGIYAVGAAARKPLAGAIGAVFFAWAVLGGVYAGSPGFIVTGEGVASPFCVAALFFVAWGVHRAAKRSRRNAWYAMAGATAALAGLAKQTALPIVLPLGLWLVAAEWTRTRALSEARLALGSYLAGFAGILGVVLARYAVAGELRTFWYWYYEYNADVYMAPYRKANVVDAFANFANDNPWAVGAFVFSTLLCVARPGRGRLTAGAAVLVRDPTVGLERTASCVALAMFAAAVAPLRFWPHYFLCVFPFVGLVVGLHTEDVLSRGGTERLSALASFVALFSATALLAFTTDRHVHQLVGEAKHGGWPNHQREAVCDVIDSYSSPTDRLFVWGFSGDLYLGCHRQPATRFLYLTLVAGIVPPFWSDVRDDRVATGAREQLIADLKKSRPPVIIDAPEPMGKVSFQQIPKVRDFIQHAYCARGEKKTRLEGTVKVWVRRDLPACAGK